MHSYCYSARCSTLTLVRLVNRQDLIHFLTRWGNWSFVYFGKTLTDVHKCFVFGFREDEIKVDGPHEAEHNEDQEGVGLQRLLQHRYKKKDTVSDEADQLDHFKVK